MWKKILKIKLKVLLAIILVVILIQVVTAYFFGVIAEKQIDLQFKNLTQSPLIKVVKRDYQRNWFGATETVELAINNQLIRNLANLLPISNESTNLTNNDNEIYTITYSTHVSSGIFAGWLHGTIYPTLAYANTKLVLPAKLNNLLNKFFANNQPLVIENIILPNKSGKYLISSPSFNYDEALSGVKVDWGGLDYQIIYNAQFDNFENKLNIPLFHLLAPTKGELSLNGFSYQANSESSIHSISVGSKELSLASLKVQLTESNTKFNQFKFGDAIHALTGVNSASFLNGLDVINPTNFSLTNVKYKSLSQDVDNYFSAQATASFESLVSNQVSYGPMNLDLSLQHINASAFNQLTDVLNDLAKQNNTADDEQAKSMQRLKQAMSPILQESPVIQLNKFIIQLPKGQISLSGKATTHDFMPSDMESQTKFMSKIVANLDFSVPKSVMAYLFVLQMKYMLSTGNTQMDAQSSEALFKLVDILLDNQLQVWLKKGYLTESGNQLSSHIALESGIISLNHLPVK
jgi:uncharacterized protein YdgA (DUF945 family)